jgi:hypothetical protein
MKIWQAILWATLAGVAGCGHQSPIQSNVIVERGEVVLRKSSAPDKPFIEEVAVPTAPKIAKPEQLLIAGTSSTKESVQNPEAAKPVPPPAELVQPVNEMIGDYVLVHFDKLADFAYEVPDDPITDPKAKAIIEKNIIPKEVADFHKKKIALKGFMLPLKVEGGKITEMLIMRDQSMCCYGTVPKINEWVSVRMPEGKGVKPIMDVPITIFGTLKVGEVLENGYLVGIYELDGDRLGGPIDL